MIPSIKEYCDALINDFEFIKAERKLLLKQIADFIQNKKNKDEPIYLVYVCTHNSRRSHFGQVWAQVAACYYNVKNVKTFSGGTEATAFNANAINALKRVGFSITSDSQASNPLYHVVFDEQQKPIECFSKVYNHEANPSSSFAAVMTCSDADENCPFIPGVELRIGTTYEDPKAFDNTPQQDEMYDLRCKQIALECLYVFSLIN